MPRTRTALIILFLFAGSLLPSGAYSQNDNTSIQTVIHLLSYVSMDYPQAVENGKVLNEQEYNEQKEFSAQAYQITKEGVFLKGKDNEVLESLQGLMKLIEEKKPAQDISSAADQINRLRSILSLPIF